MAAIRFPTLQHAAFVIMHIIVLLITYTVLRLLYNATLHPLSRFPGPLTHRLTVIPRLYHLHIGDLHQHVADLHAHYGPVVRLAPNELSFTDQTAWKTIYGRKPSGEEFAYDPVFYFNTQGPTSLLGAEKTEHDAIRKALTPSFASSALRAQGNIIGGYTDLLIARLRSQCDGGGGSRKLDMTTWLNYFTFDVLGALAFGDDFGCLEKSDYHPWVGLILGSLKNMATMQMLNQFGLLRPAMWLAQKLKVGLEARRIHGEFGKVKVRQRLDAHGDLSSGGHSDFLGKMIDMGMSFDKLCQNAGLLVIAGSETTATLLSGALFLLLTHADALHKLKEEVRSRFQHEADITLSSVNGLDYMLACLNESLRCYPPVPIAAPRVTPKGGVVIAGHIVPEKTTVGAWHWATYRSTKLFTQAEEFRPERFLGQDPIYADDRLDAIQPFLVGSRDCLGRNLAYAEMRLVLAKLIWNFDIRLADDSKAWLEGQRSHLLWAKPPLNIYLDPVVR